MELKLLNRSYMVTTEVFFRSISKQRYQNLLNIEFDFVQDNYSRSSKNVLRGLHFQKTKPQGKLVRVVRGEVFDVAVDIRKESPNYGQWIGVLLSEMNKNNFGYHQVSHMVLLYYLKWPILNINAQNIMILRMSVVYYGMIQNSIFNGL